MPVCIHNIFHQVSSFHPVHCQSVQGANILVTPVHWSVRLPPFRSSSFVFAIQYVKNNLLYQPLILRPAYVIEEVQFPLHHSLHYVDACVRSLCDIFILIFWFNILLRYFLSKARRRFMSLFLNVHVSEYTYSESVYKLYVIVDIYATTTATTRLLLHFT